MWIPVLPDITEHKIENFKINQIRGQLCAESLSSQSSKRGSEVFLSNLPRDLLLQELHAFMGSCGDICEIRLLMDFSGYNRGFGYVKYFSLKAARLAVISLNGKKLKSNYFIKVKLSFDNIQLLMRGIPEDVEQSDIQNIIEQVAGDGLQHIKIYQGFISPEGSLTKSCILRYNSHRQALEARKNMWPIIEIADVQVKVDWAFPLEIGQAQCLYCKGIPDNITAVDFFEELEKLIDIEMVLDVQVVKGYGFVTMSSQWFLLDAMRKLEENKLWDVKLEVSTKRFPDAYFHLKKNKKQHSGNDQDHIKLPLVSLQCDELNQTFEMVESESGVVPTHTLTPPPIYTLPGLLNELVAMETVLHSAVNFRHPVYKWICLLPYERRPTECIKVVVAKLTINDVLYEVRLALVPRY